MHPPYAGIIQYSQGKIQGDVSNFGTLDEYHAAMAKIAAECYRVLNRDRHCAVMIGDTRSDRHYVPISFTVLKLFIRAGFILAEDIIKIQHNTTSERIRGGSYPTSFFRIAHEHLFVFRKPRDVEDLQSLPRSWQF